MTTHKYTSKLRSTDQPAHLARATIRLRYTPDFTALNRAERQAEKISDALRHLALLAGQGLAGAQGFQYSAQALPDGVALHLAGPPLPSALVVMATRMAVGFHDSDGSGLYLLTKALDDDEAQARALWAGVDFETAIAAIEITLEGDGPRAPFDPFHVGPSEEPMVQAEGLAFPGQAFAMPRPDLEDALLLASAFGAFWPLGQVADFELGAEEWFTDGDDLVVTALSCEAASLRLLLACLSAAAQRV